MDKTSKEYWYFRANASSLIANLIYSAWHYACIQADPLPPIFDGEYKYLAQKLERDCKELDPVEFFEFHYLMSPHSTKAEWKDLVFKYYMQVVNEGGIWTEDVERDSDELYQAARKVTA